MNRPRTFRLFAGLASTLGVLATGAPPSAAAEGGDFSYARGWRVGEHPRELADVDGDDRADVVGFGDAGVFVGYGLDDGSFSAARLKLDDFGRAQGWRADRHPRGLADVDGNGRADVVGFGHTDVRVSFSHPNGYFGDPEWPAVEGIEGGGFGYAQGWRTDRHVRELDDVDGDGRADLVGFGDAGTWVALSSSEGSAALFLPPTLAISGFGHDQGWRTDRHVRELADVDGDGRADVVGFGDAGVFVSYGRAEGGFTAPVLEVRDFGHDQGWRVDEHPRQLGDLDGDGRADVVGFGDAGVFVSYSRAEGGFTAPVLEVQDFGHDQGWRVDEHPRLLSRTTTARNADIVGFGDAGTYISFGGADRDLSLAWLAAPEFGVAQGWRADRHLRALADVGGDGIPDIVGFGATRTHVWTLLIHAVPPEIFENDLSTG